MKSTNSASWDAAKTRRMVFLALFSAIIVMMAVIPNIGYVMVNPAMTLTTLQIPVIIGAILLGPADGAILGLVFGVTSMLQAPFMQGATAFLFNPFVPLGNYKSALIAIVPRVLIGVVAAYVYRLFCRFDRTQIFAALAAGLAGSLTTSIFVLGGIYLFFKNEFAAILGKAASYVLGYLVVIFTSNSIVEIAMTAIVVPLIWKALAAVIKRSSLKNGRSSAS